MKKMSMLFMAALIAFFGFVTVGCDDEEKAISPAAEQTGSVSVDFTASSQVLESMTVTKVVVKLEKGSWSDSLQLISEVKIGEFSKLDPGTYTVSVTAYDGSTVVATGTNSIVIEAGKVTSAGINLKLTQGGAEIVIEWDQLVGKAPKYIFFFIGDGMAMPQIQATEVALGVSGFGTMSEMPSFGKLNMNDLPVTGMQTTHAEDRYITGSAASATAMACGEKTSIGTIAMNSSHSLDHKTMAEMAKEKGMKVGIISSVSIDHATPAAFYAHTTSRNNYEDIGNFLVDSGFDYFAGGNVRHNKYGSAPKHESQNFADLNDFISYANNNSYTYVNTKAAFDGLTPASGKVIATLEKLATFTADGCAMPYQLDVHLQSSENDKITLADFTKKGIELLDNENGFFMMVEGGKVDWACHANDAVAAVYDMIAFDDALGEAIKFYNNHKDETLIVVAGDHECGGMTLGFANNGYATWFETLKHQSMSYVEFTSKVSGWKDLSGSDSVTFAMALDSVKTYFGLGDDSKHAELALTEYDSTRLENAFISSMTGEKLGMVEEHNLFYGYYDPFTVTVTHILNQKAGIAWTSYSHTGVPVPVLALGVGQDKFNGYYDNTDVAKKIIDIGKLDLD